jgi:hypothetical protein
VTFLLSSIFQRRKTAIFRKIKSWKTSVGCNGLEERTGDLEQAIDGFTGFLERPMTAAARAEGFENRWEPGGPWRSE